MGTRSAPMDKRAHEIKIPSATMSQAVGYIFGADFGTSRPSMGALRPPMPPGLESPRELADA